jgi:hypothetical protein
LNQGVDPPIAEYVDRIANSVEQFSTHVRQRNVDERIGDTESGARRQPAFFSGGAFLFGLVAARFFERSYPEQSRVRNSCAAMGTATNG